MKKFLKGVFCSVLGVAIIVPQMAMAETLYVNSGTGEQSFNDSKSHNYTNVIVQGSTLNDLAPKK